VESSQYKEGDYRRAAPVIGPGHTTRSITDKLASVVLTTNTPLGWFVFMFFGFSLLLGLMMALTYLFAKGIGIWGTTFRSAGRSTSSTSSGGSASATPAR